LRSASAGIVAGVTRTALPGAQPMHGTGPSRTGTRDSEPPSVVDAQAVATQATARVRRASFDCTCFVYVLRTDVTDGRASAEFPGQSSRARS